MEVVEDIVIVGGGIAGLTTSLGLHRLGIRSLVLESSDSLRVTGFAFTTWTNAWRALDAIGIGQSLRQQHQQLYGRNTYSITSGLPTSEVSFETNAAGGAPNEVRCVKRKLLMEALEKELPSGTIKYSSKVVSIEDSGYFKLLHLADGTILKTKVLIGCDGVNSVVAKWLGFKKPAFAGRLAIRGYADFKRSHGFEPRFTQCNGKGVRFGFIPCDDNTIYWFFTYIPTPKDKAMEDNPAMMKEFVLSKLRKLPDQVKTFVEITELDCIISSTLRFRLPWEILWGNTSKGNVCVAGDAFHPMTPDIGQGGCAALEDGVVLARCLAEALYKEKSNRETVVNITEEEDECKRIEMGLKKFAEERKWRAFELISTAYMVGFIQQSDGMVINFLRDKFLAAFLSGLLLKRADFDCGKLCIS
ncbi:monooxygenase 2-like [Cornus florida]|uniref:monooxygenase 2-like n=1 Tax=Cornus florida TaxID=4283 RepID=UPI00289792AE|nr:monooxygenase 2-like [Cornus florida]